QFFCNQKCKSKRPAPPLSSQKQDRKIFRIGSKEDLPKGEPTLAQPSKIGSAGPAAGVRPSSGAAPGGYSEGWSEGDLFRPLRRGCARGRAYSGGTATEPGTCAC